MIWAAYNYGGDLLATATTEDELLDLLDSYGYELDDLFIAQLWR